MRKSWVFLVLGILLISSSFAVQQVRKGHSGLEIFFKVGSSQKNLDEAFNSDGSFKQSLYTTMNSPGTIVFGHNNSEIYVNVNGSMKTFDVALSDGSLRDTPANKSPANFLVSNIKFGETANNILIEVNGGEETLQNAINAGAFFMGFVDPSGKIHITGSRWNETVNCKYSCNCGKSGCSLCPGQQLITKTVVNRVVSNVSVGNCI